MCVSYRSYDLNLADHLDDHKRALQCVEASLYDELEKAAAGAVKEAQDKFGFPPRRPTVAAATAPAEAAPPPQRQRAAAAAADGGGGAKPRRRRLALVRRAPAAPPPPPPPRHLPAAALTAAACRPRDPRTPALAPTLSAQPRRVLAPSAAPSSGGPRRPPLRRLWILMTSFLVLPI